ncbi:MAG TPA: hypothetical protein DCL15_23710 [Chloroflexi bacterium]|nr:hypothetical protein [Chloroflexota bacterium]HHW87920.1 DUF4440 domain-containing protein [Chloroflexota bacterium]
MRHNTMWIGVALILALLMVTLPPMTGLLHAQDVAFLAPDEAGLAPSETTVRFTNTNAGEGAEDAFSVTLEATAAVQEPTPVALTLDAEGVAVAEGALDPQGMMSYVLTIEAGSSVQATILPGDTGFVLTVVGADGDPLQTDHAGASSFDQIVPVSQEYTFKVINFGEETQAYQLGVVVTPGVGDVTAANTADEDLALGKQLVTQYFDALRDGDTATLEALLSPAFQLVRASGERFDASDYLDNLPRFAAYEVNDLKVTHAGDMLVASYTVRTGSKPEAGKLDPPAPRLTVFQQIDGDWKLLAHANFTTPVTMPRVLTMPKAQLTITTADNGGAVQVAAGGQVEVTLPGNPTTGYVWQVIANDESILRPLGSSFTPATDAVGAGGAETFTFQVMAPGVVDLELVNSRPWETDVEPAQTFAVTIEALNRWSGDDASITVGMDENGQTVGLLPGGVLSVALEGAADGEWVLVQSDPMVVQPLGDWRRDPGEGDDAKARFHRYFLGVESGTADLRFDFVNADGTTEAAGYSLTVVVPPREPGASGAVAATAADAGGTFTLVTGDTLVVRLEANPTTGYDWRVVSTNAALLPTAGEPVYATSADLPGAGGVDTFRFLAKAAGEATVQIGEYAPGADAPDRTLDFNVTIVDPASLTGNTVTLTDADAGKRIDMAAGDVLVVELANNPSTGYAWTLIANDGAVLRLQPDSGFAEAPATEGMTGAGGVQRFVLRALTPGVVDLEIGLFPPGSATPEKVYTAQVAVK